LNRVLLIFGIALAVSRASFGQVAFTGRVLDADNRPLRNVQIWAQLHTNHQYRTDNKDFFQTRTDSSGHFALTKLPSGEYHVAVTRIEKVDDLSVSHIKARAGDVWRLDYSIARRMATMRKESSKTIRRFEYLGSSSAKVLAGGNWEETTNGIPQWKRECAELQAHPTVVSHGAVLCAKHNIPLITRVSYEMPKQSNVITLAHYGAGIQAKKMECNPNYVPFEMSFKRDKEHTVATNVTYCPKCENAVWLTDAELRHDLGDEGLKIESRSVAR
jgi:hypothetical protein